MDGHYLIAYYVLPIAHHALRDVNIHFCRAVGLLELLYYQGHLREVKSQLPKIKDFGL